MTEMKGSDLLARVRDQYPDIVTIILTGFSETEELMWAGEMQKALLRPALRETNGVEFRTSYRPVADLYIEDDYYDVISLGQDRYLILLGDVAGHGVRAAFITAILKAVIYPEYIRHARVGEFSPAAFLSWLNDRMNFELRKTLQLLISFFTGLLDMRKRSFNYAIAGQCHPCIRRGNAVFELPVSGSAIGFASSVRYMEQEAANMSCDLLTCFTDGLVELGTACLHQFKRSRSSYHSVDRG